MRRVAPAGGPPRRGSQPPNRPCAASRGRIKTLTAEAADLQTRHPRARRSRRPPPARPARRRAPSPPAQIYMSLRTPAAAATKQPSPASPASPHSKRPPGQNTRHRLNRRGDRQLQPRAAHHRRHPQPLLPPHPGLHRQTNRRRQNPPRSPTLPQTLHRPPDLPPSSNTPKSTLDKHRSIVNAQGRSMCWCEPSAREQYPERE